MITFSLQSGSNGNAIYVEAGGVRLLFDAGITGKQAEHRMHAHGRSIRDVDALIISHDHIDHVRCAGVFQRKFGIPIHMTRKTHRAIHCELGPLTDVHYFEAGKPLEFGDVLVQTIPTPHDAADGVVFVVEHRARRLGILTDLGCPFSRLCQEMDGLDAAYIESNYDPHMLRVGPYPPHLQKRISGGKGHLSNFEAAELIKRSGRKLKWAALAHLSAENNEPYVALDTHRCLLGDRLALNVASRYEPGPLMEV